jgi:hypothetical protein
MYIKWLFLANYNKKVRSSVIWNLEDESYEKISNNDKMNLSLRLFTCLTQNCVSC